MKVHEKKRYSHSLKRIYIYRERDHTKGVSIPSTTIHTRAHLDLIVWLVFLFGSGLWLCNICNTSMPYLSCPTLSSTYSPQVGWRKGKSNALVRTYTHWAIWENQMRSYARFVFKTYWKIPSYLTWGVEVIWFATIPFLNYPRWHDRHFKVYKQGMSWNISYACFISLESMFYLSSFSFTREGANAKCGGVVDGA